MLEVAINALLLLSAQRGKTKKRPRFFYGCLPIDASGKLRKRVDFTIHAIYACVYRYILYDNILYKYKLNFF